MSKKEAKQKKLSEADATKQVYEWMKRQNRPYNAQMVSDGMKGVISKAAAEKVLDKLAEKGDLVVKEFGKARIYWPKQVDAEVDAAGMKELEEQLEAAQTEQKQLQEEVKELRETLKRLQSEPTNEEADSAIEKLTAESESLAQKLAEIKEGKRMVTKEQKEKVEKEYNKYKALWRKRKRLFREVFDTVSEAMQGKSNDEIYEMLGIETDELVGVSLENDRTTKKRKGEE